MMTSTSVAQNPAALTNLVTCMICLHPYDDPRFLLCTHTFCYRCIKSLCQDGDGQCPTGDRMIIHQRSIDQLPINRTAKDLVERMSPSKTSTAHGYGRKCDVCRRVSSEFICETCSKSYCTTCLKLSHTRSVRFSMSIPTDSVRNTVNRRWSATAHAASKLFVAIASRLNIHIIYSQRYLTLQRKQRNNAIHSWNNFSP
jgi:hypothetical protein